MIFTFENRGNGLFSTIKRVFDLNNEQMHKEINLQHCRLCKLLKEKSIDYNTLKTALIPNQDKNCCEYALLFDSLKISNYGYGNEVFKILLPILSTFKTSTYSILCGDFIPFNNNVETQELMKNILFNEMEQHSETDYQHSTQYYIVYFNRLTHTQIETLTKPLLDLPWFIGTLDLTYTTKSILKKILSTTLINFALINKKNIILPHESDIEFPSNINLYGYPFTENGFNIISISEDLFGTFLSYKIEDHFPDMDDIELSLNSISIDATNISDLSLTIENKKFIDYLKNETGKAALLRVLSLYDISKDELEIILFDKIKKCYLYNLDFLPEYNTIKFNVCIELPTKSGHLRKTVIALEYLSIVNKLRLLTIT